MVEKSIEEKMGDRRKGKEGRKVESRREGGGEKCIPFN